MKFLAVLLFLACSCAAQTLKWTQTTPAIPFEVDTVTLMNLRCDAAGNVAVCLEYTDSNGQAGVGLLWYSAAGKLLHAHHEAGDSLFSGQIISVSASSVVVGFASNSGNPVLRKYSRRGAVVTFKDTPLPATDQLDNGFPYITATDKLGFYVVVTGPLGYAGIKRFTVR